LIFSLYGKVVEDIMSLMLLLLCYVAVSCAVNNKRWSGAEKIVAVSAKLAVAVPPPVESEIHG